MEKEKSWKLISWPPREKQNNSTQKRLLVTVYIPTKSSWVAHLIKLKHCPDVGMPYNFCFCIIPFLKWLNLPKVEVRD